MLLVVENFMVNVPMKREVNLFFNLENVKRPIYPLIFNGISENRRTTTNCNENRCAILQMIDFEL